MFSTLVAVRELQPNHALRKQLVAGVADQESNTLAGKEVKEVHCLHASCASVALVKLIEENDFNLGQLYQVLLTLVTLPKSVASHLKRLVADVAAFNMLSSQNPPPSIGSYSTLISCKPISGLNLLVPF